MSDCGIRVWVCIDDMEPAVVVAAAMNGDIWR